MVFMFGHVSMYIYLLKLMQSNNIHIENINDKTDKTVWHHFNASFSMAVALIDKETEIRV